MVEFISTWAEQVVVAVIIATILELIIPKGNNKKYIKVIIGVYILFTIISPVINRITGDNIKLDFNYEKYFNNYMNYEIQSNAITTTNNQNIEDIYIQNLKKDIINKVEERGVKVNNIQLDINFEDYTSYGNINKIVLEVEEDNKNSIHVNEVIIGKNTNNTNINKLDEDKAKEIKNYLSNTYSLNSKYIIIK